VGAFGLWSHHRITWDLPTSIAKHREAWMVMLPAGRFANWHFHVDDSISRE